jgi:hypothetical protein
MHEIRNRLYDENERLTSEELNILNFETDFSRTYDAIYWNNALDNFLDSLWIYQKGEHILKNPKNKQFFKKLYEESWITITSDRELTTLYIIRDNVGYGLEF